MSASIGLRAEFARETSNTVGFLGGTATSPWHFGLAATVPFRHGIPCKTHWRITSGFQIGGNMRKNASHTKNRATMRLLIASKRSSGSDAIEPASSIQCFQDFVVSG